MSRSSSSVGPSVDSAVSIVSYTLSPDLVSEPPDLFNLQHQIKTFIKYATTVNDVESGSPVFIQDWSVRASKLPNFVTSSCKVSTCNMDCRGPRAHTTQEHNL